MKFATKAVHAGVEPDSSTGAIMTPIFQTSTYVIESSSKNKGYCYSRSANPTRTALENSLASIENGRFGICFSSGMSATDAVLRLLNPGDEVIASNDIYGGSFRLFTKIYQRFGIKFHFIDLLCEENILAVANEKTRLIWIETPTNPLMNIIDIAMCAKVGKKINALLAVDNTFSSPYLQNPLELGADIVMHSVTKYLSGHSDVVMGALIVNDEKLYENLSFISNSCGAIPGPQDCFLVLRGIKTLHLRMERHCYNGKKVAEFLKQDSKVNRVYWPGFSDQIQKSIVDKQMKDYGGMLSFTLKSDKIKAVNTLIENVEIFSLAESLGGVESLINHPATMTHASIPKDIRMKVGLTDSLIRLSIGIEDSDDLIDDLKQALVLV